MPFDLTLLSALWLALALFGAAFVRGYSGFGFSALVVTASALVTNPLNLVAVVLFCEILLSAQSWRAARAGVDWGRVRPLILGAAIGMPPGIWALTRLPEAWVKITIAGFVLLMCLILLKGWQMARPADAKGNFLAGIASGLANGPGMGGLPVAAFFAAQPIPASVFRATLIAYFPLLDAISLPIYALAGLITRDSFIATAMALPLIFLGNHLGGRRFFGTDPQGFRRFALILLAALALLALGRAII